MAEGGYDPRDETTDKDPLISKKGDDDDDDDFDLSKYDIHGNPIDPETTGSFTPGAASTPAGGESIPMTERTSLPQERGPRAEETSFTTTPDSIPNVSEVNFVDEEEKEKQLKR